MKRNLFILGLTLVFVPAVRAGDPKPAKVPFHLITSQHIYIKAKINGEGPFNLIFDTGAPFSLINNRVAKASGIIDKNTKGPGLPIFGLTPATKIKTFEVGELKAENLPVMVMDHPTVAAISKAMQPTIGGPIDGIMGLSFFSKYKLTIDYQAKEMTFTPSNYEPKDAVNNLMSAFSSAKVPPKILAPAALWGFRVAKGDKDEEAGVDVKDVLPGSPAAQAGLKSGDRLLTLAGRWTDSVVDCYAASAFVQPGQMARLVIKRDGKEMELNVKVQAGL